MQAMEVATASTATPWVPSMNDLDEHLLARVLHMAAAPRRTGVGGAAVVVKQWAHLATVCRRWVLPYRVPTTIQCAA